MLAEKINNHKIAIECDNARLQEELEEEINQLKRRDPDQEGKLQLIKKEDMIESLGNLMYF